MKTKDESFAASKQWFAEIADIREKFPLLAVLRDNSGEITSKELNDFFMENGVKNYFNTLYEQWQNGLAESDRFNHYPGQNSNGKVQARRPMWFSAVIHAVNCRNGKFKKRLGTTPREKVFGVKKDVSKF